MIAAVTAALSLFSIGHINVHGDVPITNINWHNGNRIEVALPPRTELSLVPGCKYLIEPVVKLSGKRQHGRWIDSYSVERYGPIEFNGIAFDNFSRTKWATVSATIRAFKGCHNNR